MAKKNLPNIPIYIGDWERDCNVLSLESEAAWMRIVFKLWTKGKQNAIKIPTKSLQNLWRCSAEKMREILDDLIYNEIGEITESQGFIEFSCRRFVKENEISKIRSEASKSNQNANKTSTKAKQKLNKKTQNTDIDYENESDNKSCSEIPTLKEFLEYAKSKKAQVNEEEVSLKYEAWKVNSWRTGGENPRKIKNWKTTLLNTLPHLKTQMDKKAVSLNVGNPNRQ